MRILSDIASTVGKKYYSRDPKKRRKHLSQAVAGVAAYCFALPISAGLVQLGASFDLCYDLRQVLTHYHRRGDAEYQALSTSGKGLIWLEAVLVHCVVTPFLEEIIFRQGIQRGLCVYTPKRLNLIQIEPTKHKKNVLGKVLRVALSTATFSLAHLANMHADPRLRNLQLIITSGLGFTVAVLREMKGGLWAPTTLHMTHNLACVSFHAYSTHA